MACRAWASWHGRHACSACTLGMPGQECDRCSGRTCSQGLLELAGPEELIATLFLAARLRELLFAELDPGHDRRLRLGSERAASRFRPGNTSSCSTRARGFCLDDSKLYSNVRGLSRMMRSQKYQELSIIRYLITESARTPTSHQAAKMRRTLYTVSLHPIGEPIASSTPRKKPDSGTRSPMSDAESA